MSKWVICFQYLQEMTELASIASVVSERLPQSDFISVWKKKKQLKMSEQFCCWLTSVIQWCFLFSYIRPNNEWKSTCLCGGRECGGNEALPFYVWFSFKEWLRWWGVKTVTGRRVVMWKEKVPLCAGRAGSRQVSSDVGPQSVVLSSSLTLALQIKLRNPQPFRKRPKVQVRKHPPPAQRGVEDWAEGALLPWGFGETSRGCL